MDPCNRRGGGRSAPRATLFSLASVVASFEASSREKRRPVHRRRLFHGRLSLNVCDARTERRGSGGHLRRLRFAKLPYPPPPDMPLIVARFFHEAAVSPNLTQASRQICLFSNSFRGEKKGTLDARVHLHFPFRSQF